MTLPAGARFQNGEVERVAKALEELAKDPHAPRKLNVEVVLHVHHEYPKLLYKGTGTSKAISVGDADAEATARDAGYGEHLPELAEAE